MQLNTFITVTREYIRSLLNKLNLVFNFFLKIINKKKIKFFITEPNLIIP